MKKTFIILIGILTFISASGQNGKRGIAYGHHTPQDMEVLSPEVSWWYNWSIKPESTVASVFEEYGFAFIPMTWNDNYNEANLREYLDNHPETRYILAFNEPNFIEQAKMTPTQVAAAWPKLEAIADDYNLEIVSPAVNFCGNCVSENGTTYTDPFDFLDDFFEACPDCRVDHIAVHSYMNTVSALEWFIGEFKRYGKPIWLTEFAGWEENGNIGSVEDQIDYLIGAVNFLENDTSVFRYAWFIGRYDGIENYPYIDLLGANGELTALGEVYKNMPVRDVNKVFQVPAVIEAEEYNTMNGIQVEKTDDVSGFINVSDIDVGDWLEYQIDVPETADYNLHLRIASTKSSSVHVVVDGKKEFTKNLPDSGGTQNWSTVSNLLHLTAGTHTLRLYAATSGFNINWFEVENLYTGISVFNNGSIRFSPNPTDDILNIKSSVKIKEFQILDLMGKNLRTFPSSTSLDLGFLTPGIYSLKAIEHDGSTVSIKKIIKR